LACVNWCDTAMLDHVADALARTILAETIGRLGAVFVEAPRTHGCLRRRFWARRGRRSQCRGDRALTTRPAGGPGRPGNASKTLWSEWGSWMTLVRHLCVTGE
jgi:hypothetical protein